MDVPNNNILSAGAVYLFKGKYFIGGNVMGLPFGGSLELSLNGSDILTVNNNGAFEFATDVQAKSSYTVSISSVPSGYTCSIINASGSVNYDVTTVNVFCSNKSFSVDGSVIGLTGAGLVLQNNDTDDLSLSNNGIFTFINPIINGSTYDVSILNEPEDQTCTIDKTSGTV